MAVRRNRDDEQSLARTEHVSDRRLPGDGGVPDPVGRPAADPLAAGDVATAPPDASADYVRLLADLVDAVRTGLTPPPPPPKKRLFTRMQERGLIGSVAVLIGFILGTVELHLELIKFLREVFGG